MVDQALDRAANGGRITPEEALAIYEDASLEDLSAAADAVSIRRTGDVITYNVNAHLNPTNICVVGCGFCAFAVWTEQDERAYAYSIDQLVERATELADHGITELHIVGGMTKEYDLPYYEELFRELKATLPQVSLTALTAVEVDFVARMAKVGHREALDRLREAGHDTMPGGGAEVFSPRVRKIIADRKVPAETWLEVHRHAHASGLRTNATLLFGHFETPDEQIDHMSMAYRMSAKRSKRSQAAMIALAKVVKKKLIPEITKLGKAFDSMWDSAISKTEESADLIVGHINRIASSLKSVAEVAAVMKEDRGASMSVSRRQTAEDAAQRVKTGDARAWQAELVKATHDPGWYNDYKLLFAAQTNNIVQAVTAAGNISSKGGRPHRHSKGRMPPGPE